MAGLAVLATMLVVVVGAPAAYAAATLHVDGSTGTDSVACGAADDPCQTIGQAVANASAGDTIEVAAGTYDESESYGTAVSIDKSLTLEGAQAGHAGTAARVAATASESNVTGGNIFVAAADVTIDGFSFGYAGNQVCVACSTASSGTASDVTIEDNVFSGYEPNDFGDYQVTSALGVNAAPGTQITGNYFTSPDRADVGAVQFFNGGCGNTDVSDNIFDAAANDGLGTIFFYCDDQTSADITVSGNDDTHEGDSNGESGVIFEHVNGDVHLTDNTVSASATSGSVFYFTLSSDLGAVEIRGNSVSGSASSGVTIRPTGGGTGTYTITGNRLSAGKYGVYVYNDALDSGATVTLRGNVLSGNSQDGVFDDSSSGGSVDATDNWWGCNDGPGATGCSAVSGDVTFDPWLVLGISATPGSLTIGGGRATIRAGLTRDSDGDAVSGSSTILDGTSVDFATDLGGVSASSATTSSGTALVTLTSSRAGTAHVSATLASETVSTAVAFAEPAPAETTTTPATTTTQTTTATTTTTTTTTTTGPPPANTPASAAGSPGGPGGVSVVAAPPSGPPLVFSVDWGAGAFTGPVTVAVTPEPKSAATAGGFAAGSAVVQLVVTGEGGAKVTSFARPLRIHISAVAAGDLPAYSADGVTWTPIPQLLSLPLPDDQPDGYFLNPDGSVDVYTHHATLFGYVRDVEAPTRVTLHLRVTRKDLRFALLGARDNVAVTGYVVWRNGRGFRAVKTSYFPLPLRAGRYWVVAVDAAHNVSRASNTITVVRVRDRKRPFRIRR